MYRKSTQTSIFVVTVTVSVLIFIKFLAGFLSHSIAILSDAVHSVTDLIVAITSLIGLNLAQRPPDKRFNYGYYKIENIVSLFISGIILASAGDLIYEGIIKLQPSVSLSLPVIAFVATIISALASGILAIYLRRVSKRTGSPTIAANATDKALDTVTSIVVLGAVLASYFKIGYVEGAITILVSLLSIKVGLDIGWQSILVLLDFTDTQLEESIANVIRQSPEIVDFARLRLRKAGAFYLGDCEIQVNENLSIEEAHNIADKVEKEIKKHFPNIISFVVHIEPAKREIVTIVFPIKENNGLESIIAEHFGRAPLIFKVTYNQNENRVLQKTVSHNPFLGKKSFIGLSLTKWIIRQDIHVVITKMIGEIAFYRLKAEHVKVLKANCVSVRDCLQAFVDDRLESLTPHSKEEEKN